MALRAIVIEIIGRMIGICRRIIIVLMATVTIHRSTLVAVGMAGYALCC